MNICLKIHRRNPLFINQLDPDSAMKAYTPIILSVFLLLPCKLNSQPGTTELMKAIEEISADIIREMISQGYVVVAAEYRKRSPAWQVKKYRGTPLLIHTNTNDEDVNVLEVEHLIKSFRARGKSGFFI